MDRFWLIGVLTVLLIFGLEIAKLSIWSYHCRENLDAKNV